MNQSELDAIPEYHQFSYLEWQENGKTVRRPVINPLPVTWAEENEPIAAVDTNGTSWRLCTLDGTRYKVRA